MKLTENTTFTKKWEALLLQMMMKYNWSLVEDKWSQNIFFLCIWDRKQKCNQRTFLKVFEGSWSYRASVYFDRICDYKFIPGILSGTKCLQILLYLHPSLLYVRWPFPTFTRMPFDSPPQRANMTPSEFQLVTHDGAIVTQKQQNILWLQCILVTLRSP